MCASFASPGPQQQEHRQALWRCAGGKPGRQLRHLQLNHSGVVAGQAAVRGIHERLSFPQGQGVSHLLQVDKLHRESGHRPHRLCVKRCGLFTATYDTNAAVRPPSRSVSIKVVCLLRLQDRAALAAHHGQLPAGCVGLFQSSAKAFSRINHQAAGACRSSFFTLCRMESGFACAAARQPSAPRSP